MLTLQMHAYSAIYKRYIRYERYHGTDSLLIIPYLSKPTSILSGRSNGKVQKVRRYGRPNGNAEISALLKELGTEEDF